MPTRSKSIVRGELTYCLTDVIHVLDFSEGIAGERPVTANPVEAIDLDDLQYIVRKLSGGKLNNDKTLEIAEDVRRTKGEG